MTDPKTKYNLPMRPPYILALIIAAFTMATALKAQDPATLKEYKNAKQLNKVTDEDLVCGYLSLYIPKDNKKLIGKQEVDVTSLTSNFDGSYFKTYREDITLDQPISKEFIKWADKVQPARLIFKPVDQNGQRVHKIVGYANAGIGFPPKMELFPEFKDFQLIDFSQKENLEKYQNKYLIAGSPSYRAGEGDAYIDIHYPTISANGKTDLPVTYMTFINLDQGISPDLWDYIRIFTKGDLVFEQVSKKTPSDDTGITEKGTFQLIGFSGVSFTFSPNCR